MGGKRKSFVAVVIVLIVLLLVIAAYFLTKPKPAEFEISNLTVSPSEAEANQPILISVDVKNTGGEGGTKKLEFNVDGETITENVELDSGESETVSLEIVREEAGTYEIKVGGLSKTIEVSTAMVSPSNPNAVVNASVTHQEIKGFGASVAWYRTWVTKHPNKSEIYDLIFDGLGLDILRLRNTYRYQDNFTPPDQEIVQKAEESLGHPIDVLITSWSPPADLKSNNNTEDGGTLDRKGGDFVYDSFAQYWRDSLEAYKSVGIEPTYISIQNEPDYEATWESCKLTPTETESLAGYNLALESTYNELQDMQDPPKILGPETTGIGLNKVQNYLNSLDEEFLDGHAFHLYNGGEVSNPDSFNANLRELVLEYPNVSRFMTEFGRGDWFQTAWIMHNSLVQGNVNAYLYWELFWNDSGLVDVDNFESESQWENPRGYEANKVYYAFKQYSKFVNSGWRRISGFTESPNLKVSAFLSPEGDNLTVVVLNTSNQDSELSLDVKNFSIDESFIYRTSESENFVHVGEFVLGENLTLPPKSITTIVMKGELEQAATADDTPPSVFIESPSSGEEVQGKVEIKGRVSEDFSLLGKVEIKIENGVYRPIEVDFGPSHQNGNWSYSWNTFPLPNGTYDITIRATNLLGKTGTGTLTLKVDNPTDETPPTISFESPSGGEKVSGVIEARGTVSDDRGIGKIRIFVDNEEETSLVYNSSSGTQTFGIFTEFLFERGEWAVTLDTPRISNGTHDLMVKATDEYGNTKAESVEIEVQNGGVFAKCENEIYWGSYKGGGGSISKSSVSGFEGKAIRADYSGGEGGWWGIVKSTYRDFSGYSGMEFYLRGDPNRVRIMIRDSGDEVWTYKLSPTEDWKKVKVPFENFIQRPDWQPSVANQNNVLDLDCVVEFHFIQPLGEERNAEGTLYVDELKLYK